MLKRLSGLFLSKQVIVFPSYPSLNAQNLFDKVRFLHILLYGARYICAVLSAFCLLVVAELYSVFAELNLVSTKYPIANNNAVNIV